MDDMENSYKEMAGKIQKFQLVCNHGWLNWSDLSGWSTLVRTVMEMVWVTFYNSPNIFVIFSSQPNQLK